MRWKSDKDKKEAEILNSDQISETNDISKYILKEVAKDYLPDDIINRKKLGPPAPLNDWFGGEFKASAKELLLARDSKLRPLFNTENLEKFLEYKPSNSNNRHGLNVWMLTTLEQWVREYNVVL
jgi:asparagine synthase (glutamine-hydrolysing)